MSLTKVSYSMITGAPVNVLDFGAVGDGVTNDAAALALANTAAANNSLVFSAGTYIVASNISFSSTVGLIFMNGAKLSPNVGVTITIDGPIQSPSGKEIFTGAGTIAATYDPSGTGINNHFSGPYAGVANAPGPASVGTQNTGFGAQALRTNATGYGHTAVGANAMRLQNGGYYSVAVGLNALRQATNIKESVAVGMNSQQSVTTVSAIAANVSMGTNSLYSLTTGVVNTAIGHSTSYSGVTVVGTVAVGSQALYTNTGDYNVAVGADALRFNQTAVGNVAVGPFALTLNNLGYQNTAIGNNTLASNTSGFNNTACGSQVLDSAVAASNNTGIGAEALTATTGSQNTAVGANSLALLTTGTNCTALGYDAQASAVGITNEITLGNSFVATLRCQVTSITALSDERDKTNIVDSPVGLNFINDIRPVLFDWARRDGEKLGEKGFGFVAQQLDSVQQKYNAEEYLNLVYKSNPDKLEATPANMFPAMVKAIQELSAEVDKLRATLNVLT